MIRIFYEDKDLIVCEKPVGVLSQPDPTGDGQNMLALLEDYRRTSGDAKPFVGVIHRMDRGVGGVMVFALRQDVAGTLSQAVAEHTLGKEYLAVVHGCPDAPEGDMVDLLYKDAAANKSYVVETERRGVKKASLSYRMVATREDTPAGRCSLVHVRLHTGRTHQIRVQFSHRAMPLVGDGKYGARDHGMPIGLWSYRLCFRHPRRKEQIDVCCLPEGEPFSWFAGELAAFEKK